MVKERRYVFDVRDITGIIYACTHCGQEIVCKPDGEYAPGDRCVSCYEPLAGQLPSGINPARTLLTTIRHLRRMSNPTARVRFVVSDPDEGKKSDA